MTDTAPRTRLVSITIVVGVTALLALTGIAGERAAVALVVRDGQESGQDAAAAFPIALFSAGIVGLAALYWAAWRRLGSRRVAAWLITVSSVGTVVFALLALLDLGFWATARQAGAEETWGVGALFFVTAAGPCVASVVAGIVLFATPERRQKGRVSRFARPARR